MKKVVIPVLILLIIFFTGCGKELTYNYTDANAPAPAVDVSV